MKTHSTTAGHDMCKKDTVSFRSRPELRLSDDDQLADWRLPGHGGSGGSRKAQWVGWGRAPGGGGRGEEETKESAGARSGNVQRTRRTAANNTPLPPPLPQPILMTVTMDLIKAALPQALILSLTDTTEQTSH